MAGNLLPSKKIREFGAAELYNGPSRFLLRSFALVTLVFLSICSPLLAAPDNVGALYWQDEFDGTSLDMTKWAYYPWSTRNDARVSPNAVSVANGVLTMKVYTENGLHYTGFIQTARRNYDGSYGEMLFATTYGYLEVRAKFHSSPGMWSAFWITSPTIGNPIGQPEQAGTEIDVVEHRAVNKSGSTITPVENKYNIGIHWDGYGDEHQFVSHLTSSMPGLNNDTWHTYGVLWSPEGYSFYYDDQLVWTAPTTVPVSERPQFLLLSSEVKNNSWAGIIPTGGYGTRQESLTEMQVDYVRAYYLPPPPIPGDYNADGVVDIADYTVWADSFGRRGVGLPADGNGDGRVNLPDYTIWADHFGESLSE